MTMAHIFYMLQLQFDDSFNEALHLSSIDYDMSANLYPYVLYRFDETIGQTGTLVLV